MQQTSARLRRLGEELEEAGLPLGDDAELLLEEVDHALRPPIHERRVPSTGTILDPTTPRDTWGLGTDLEITLSRIGDQPLEAARRFADGMSSWLVRRHDGPPEWLVFDRPAGSERDLGVISRALGARVVQRHPNGVVRIVDEHGTYRWNGFSWHHEPPVDHWIDTVRACQAPHDVRMLQTLLEFAVHDLGADGIGALLIYRETENEGPPVEHRLPEPPPLRIDQPTHLAPLRHALSQIDGAAVFDHRGVLRELGVRLIPSSTAEDEVDGFKGTRHTSGRRYSYDDPDAIVIAVSEDGPVSVFHRGKVLGRSQPEGPLETQPGARSLG
jgi:hypothetical protein